MLTIFFAALAALFGIGFFAVLVGASQQADDLRNRIGHRDARIEDLTNEVRWHQRRHHPAGRGLSVVSEPTTQAARDSLREAMNRRDAELYGIDPLREALEERDGEWGDGA